MTSATPMSDVYNVLFLCTGNSARSILAEVLLNRLGAGRFRGYSAGSFPKGEVNPATIQLLKGLDYDVSGLRSKSWDEFAKLDAPPLDFVFTVCDDAAGESCPLWPGKPMTAHWGIPDPAAVKGDPAEVAIAFNKAYQMMKRRIELFVALPIASIDKMAIGHKLKEIGASEGATDRARAGK